MQAMYDTAADIAWYKWSSFTATVAILAQGTSWADAATQAFFGEKQVLHIGPEELPDDYKQQTFRLLRSFDAVPHLSTDGDRKNNKSRRSCVSSAEQRSLYPILAYFPATASSA